MAPLLARGVKLLSTETLSAEVTGVYARCELVEDLASLLTHSRGTSHPLAQAGLDCSHHCDAAVLPAALIKVVARNCVTVLARSLPLDDELPVRTLAWRLFGFASC
jgi:hypothetical protein